jgi:hypothetical protein
MTHMKRNFRRDEQGEENKFVYGVYLKKYTQNNTFLYFSLPVPCVRRFELRNLSAHACCKSSAHV